jgi:dihydrofolate reductase
LTGWDSNFHTTQGNHPRNKAWPHFLLLAVLSEFCAACRFQADPFDKLFEEEMAKLVFGMMVSLDGYVAGVDGNPAVLRPGPLLHRHFNDHVRGLAGCLYGRRMYEVMRYWDEDQPDWDEMDHDFAAAWRGQPKWVVSRTLKSVGPNATLVADDIETVVRRLKLEVEGEIDVAGPELAGSLTSLGLIDEYHLYFRPVVLGSGKPYFAAPRPPLRHVATSSVGEDGIKLSFVPS